MANVELLDTANDTIDNDTDDNDDSTEVQARRTRGPRKEKPSTILIELDANGQHTLNLCVDGNVGVSFPLPIEVIKASIWSMVEKGQLISVKMVKLED